MWTKALLALLVSSTVWAMPSTEINIVQLKQQWQTEQKQAEKKLAKQREDFLQLESLLQIAEKQGKVSPQLLKLAEQLYDPTYPLAVDADWILLKAKLVSEMAQDLALVKSWIADFSSKHPEIAKRNKLSQRLFRAYYDQQKFAELVEYANTNPPDLANQCLVYSAQFQLLAEKAQPNPEAEQAGVQSVVSDEMKALLADFDQFWIAQANLPSECSGIESYWRDQDFKTDEKIRVKAVQLFQQNAKTGLEQLALNSVAELSTWLGDVQKLLVSPAELQNFAENQPLDPQNKSLIIKAFPAFIKTLPEQLENPDFSRFQNWAKRWGLSADEVREWKISFLSRFFDNSDPVFQLWRDEQLKQVKADNLTERRLRMAILQQSDLTEWLELLSDEGKYKAEWRYWLAKSDAHQAEKILSELVKERGFYPMLAAELLGKSYQISLPEIKRLTDLQKNQFNLSLERIAELRYLHRFGSAKLAWADLLQAVSFEEKLALADYAIQQDWYDLAVEATIQAKAWDYIPLRLPNAYADWFALNLADKPIHQSFAMAIARQESAWNFQAKSHANAIGLMQMLPSTAAATAKNNNLPYQSEKDLVVPFKNIMLGTAHLAELNEKYPNNRILISAAYNAGASRVERWLERAGGRLKMDEFIASIPFYETRGYVQNVLAYDFYYQSLYGQSPMMFTQEEKRVY